MKIKGLLTTAAMGAALIMGANSVSANTQAVGLLAGYAGVGTLATSCATCHTTAPQLNPFGTAYFQVGGTKNSGYTLTAGAWSSLSVLDSDGDGTDNVTEITNGSNPGMSGTTAAASQGSASMTGCMTASIATPLTMALAMLTLGFFVRRKKD